MKCRIEDGVVYSPFPSCEIPRCSFYTMVKEWLAKTPSKRALVDDAITLTRHELFQRLQRYGAGFQEHGIVPGDRICIHLSNCVENFVSMFGCIMAGATVILAKTTLTARELHYQMQDGDATHVLTDTAYVEKVLAASSTLQLKGIFVMGDAPGFVSALKFKGCSEKNFKEVEIPDPENSVLGITYTSGTTGLPKGVEITHYSYVGNVYTSGPCMSSDDTDIVLGNFPITHASGLMISMGVVLLGGVCVVTSPFLSPEEICDTVNKHKITSMFLFTSRLQALVQTMRRTGNRLSSMRRIGVGGSPLSAELFEEALSVFEGAECLMNMYGLSESCSVICSPSIRGVKHVDMGFPGVMTEMRIVDVNTREKLGPNKVGELEFRNPCVMRGYYKKPEATAAFKDQDGWCHSGDLAYYDEDGRFYFVERIKEMIKCMDNQVVPAELEGLLMASHEGIDDVAVIGLPHPVYGEAPAAVVILNEQSKVGGQVTAEGIQKIIADTCAPHKHLSGGVFFADSLPRTETGKIMRKALVDQYSRLACSRVP
uniref:Putative acyl-coa synthetase n=1 Tax=Ixodes ricinus TaxID=34613 RepID=A0A131XU13_IXORI